MDELLILLGLATLAVPVVVIALVVAYFRLSSELGKLRAEFERFKKEHGKPEAKAQRNWTGETIEPRALAQPITPLTQAPKDIPKPEEPAPKPVDRPKRDEAPPATYVVNTENTNQFGTWISQNWFYVASALSLALAGIFLVQYSMENGLLSPRLRVLLAAGFGVALIIAGEIVRRRIGDEEGVSTAYIPSVFSSAGVVSLFASIVAGRMLYDLIGQGTAFSLLSMVALLALCLGWFYGPLLAAIGVVGAYAAPFVIGGSSEDLSPLLAYFALIATLGLGIDTVRRWAWISVLTLCGAFATGTLLMLSTPEISAAYGAYMAGIALLATIIPARSPMPRQGGTMISELLVKTKEIPWPEFPTRLAFGAVLVASLALLSVAGPDFWAHPNEVAVFRKGPAEFWLAVVLLAALTLAFVLWSARAPAFQDIALLPALTLLGALALHGVQEGRVWLGFYIHRHGSEHSDPWTGTLLFVLGVIISAAFLWRALGSQGSRPRFALIHALAAALYAPAMAVILDLLWQAREVFGPYPWALHATAMAGLMVFFAERLAKRDGPEDKLRMALPVLSAISSLSFAFTILFVETALTLAFAATVLGAAVLDRMLKLPLMNGFITVAAAVLGYRLVMDPGVSFGVNAPLGEMSLVYLGSLAALLGALWALRDLPRLAAKTILESGAWSVAGVYLSLLLNRFSYGAGEVGVFAAIWLILMAVQLHRLHLGGMLRYARGALAGLFGFFGFSAVLISLSIDNPLLHRYASDVIGARILFNSLAPTYLLPAVVLALAAWLLKSLNPNLRKSFAAISLGIASFWLFASIRYFWQGSEMLPISYGVSQPELYTYTVALLAAGAGCLYQALARGSDQLRRVATGLLGLTVLKVFFIDAAELSGLTRVFSFLLLGLALAALAWLSRWAAERSKTAPEEEIS